ncbi:MAG: C10 family peptidase [Phycisphaerae bacterium]|nr:C10 family peptidase [Phycisphaerae bacterium]
MKNIIFRILIASFAAIMLISETQAQIVTTDQALVVANNWIDVIIQKKGSWGDADSAHVDSIRQFKRGDRLLGYFCNVEPVGYIVVSLRKEFAPVKAYSARTELDPDMDEGMADLLKDRMERILDKVEERFGSITTARSEDLSSLFEVDYKLAWEVLEKGVPPIEKADVGAAAASDYVEGGNYQEGDVLLDTSWWQGSPYNLYCPAPPPDSDCEWDHCTVGCNATAGAQVLRHWCWPPYGEGGSPYTDIYEWWNMPNTVVDTSPAEQINATAELNYEVGIAGQSSYCASGCGTGSHIEIMRPGYTTHFRYSVLCWVAYRNDYSASEWFSLIQEQLNNNRPMTYGIPGHAIVCDGWQIIDNPPLYVRQYHMNWGWADTSRDIWYTLDSLADPSVEHLLADHFPIVATGSGLMSGIYPKNALPYWYFDQDATAHFATTFASGNYLQFLNGIRLKAAGSVRIESTVTENTRIFSGGDPRNGIRLYSGTMTLTSGGSLKVY